MFWLKGPVEVLKEFFVATWFLFFSVQLLCFAQTNSGKCSVFFFFSILHQLLIIFMLFFCAPFLGLSTLRVHRNWMKPFAPSVRSCKAVTVRTCCAVKQTRCYESLVSSLSLNRDGNSAGYREKLQRRTCKMGREMLSSHFGADSWLDFPSVNSSGNAPWLVQSWQITHRLGLWTLTYSFI